MWRSKHCNPTLKFVDLEIADLEIVDPQQEMAPSVGNGLSVQV